MAAQGGPIRDRRMAATSKRTCSGPRSMPVLGVSEVAQVTHSFRVMLSVFDVSVTLPMPPKNPEVDSSAWSAGDSGQTRNSSDPSTGTARGSRVASAAAMRHAVLRSLPVRSSVIHQNQCSTVFMGLMMPPSEAQPQSFGTQDSRAAKCSTVPPQTCPQASKPGSALMGTWWGCCVVDRSFKARRETIRRGFR